MHTTTKRIIGLIVVIAIILISTWFHFAAPVLFPSWGVNVGQVWMRCKCDPYSNYYNERDSIIGIKNGYVLYVNTKDKSVDHDSYWMFKNCRELKK